MTGDRSRPFMVISLLWRDNSMQGRSIGTGEVGGKTAMGSSFVSTRNLGRRLVERSEVTAHGQLQKSVQLYGHKFSMSGR